VDFDFSDSDIEDVFIYGGLLNGISGTVKFSADATNGISHHLSGLSFSNCGQVDVGRVVVRNCQFNAYTLDANAALLWNANINIKNCDFLGNTNDTTGVDPHAIEHPASGTFDYYGLNFAGNDYDINFSDPTTGVTLTIGNQPGSNASTYEITGNGTTVTINTTVTLTITVRDRDRVAIVGAQTTVRLLNSPFTTLMNEDTVTGGIASESYNYVSDVDVVVGVRKSDDLDDPRYKAHSSIQTIDENGLTLSVELLEQPVPI
jgi:hypothetical protein